MTDIKDMSDAELDAAIAVEVMGGTHGNDGCLRLNYNEDAGVHGITIIDWHPATDLNHAVEACGGACGGGDFGLMLHKLPDGWGASFWPTRKPPAGSVLEKPTPARALSEALLAAVRAELTAEAAEGKVR